MMLLTTMNNNITEQLYNYLGMSQKTNTINEVAKEIIKITRQ
jgi:hypothetical protein